MHTQPYGPQECRFSTPKFTKNLWKVSLNLTLRCGKFTGKCGLSTSLPWRFHLKNVENTQNNSIISFSTCNKRKLTNKMRNMLPLTTNSKILSRGHNISIKSKENIVCYSTESTPTA